MQKRIFSMLLTIVMVAGLLPGTAWAEETAEPLSVVTQTYVPESDLPDNDELFAMYAEQILYGYEMSTFGTKAREGLNDIEKAIYDALKTQIEAVAQSGGSTVFTLGNIEGLKTSWTNAEMNVGSLNVTEVASQFEAQFKSENIMNALLGDCPFDLYWFDKEIGIQMNYQMSGTYTGSPDAPVYTCIQIVDITFTFSVTNDYSGSAANTVSSDVKKVTDAAAKAKDVVAVHESKTSYEKLVAYKEYICGAVSYNDEAASDSYTGGYGDPWQLIYVFDGDPSTNVVCEGYSKAFQYLCDLGGLDCISVTGTLNGGNHMWNVVTLNGKNYLVDVTNCDEGTVGAPNKLFMVGGTYQNDSYTYTFDEHNSAIYSGCGYLGLAAEPFEPENLVGDVNGDNKLDEEDSKLLNRYFAGHSVTISKNLADVDNDGTVTRRDAMILARHYAGWQGYTLPYTGK